MSFRRKPESRKYKHFWTPATLSRRKPGAGVTALGTFYEPIKFDGFVRGHKSLFPSFRRLPRI